MAFADDTLSYVYDRTNGRCHLCRKKLSFSNYGKFGRKGAWEIDHSRSRANGGMDHLNNLFAACIACNRSKQVSTSRSQRQLNGFTRAPLSKAKLDEARQSNAGKGAIVGGLLGLLAGPGTALVAAGLGAWIGSSVDPEE